MLERLAEFITISTLLRFAEFRVAPPEAFISYSWTSPAHEDWVLVLARELVSQGIHVVLDKWDLREGHDAIAFMESMISDPEIMKVIMIFDKGYVEKSNARTGGDGTEAQIITPELYAKKTQDKFVAVIREIDDEGHPYVPTYYRGRIHIDLSDDENYSAEFERLVRWAWGKPLNVRPDLGPPPTFLSEDAAPPRLETGVPFRRALEAVKGGRENSPALTREYLQIVSRHMERFRISGKSEDFDDQVAQSVEAFVPYRNELAQLFLAIALYRADDQMTDTLHTFFESLIPYLDRPENVNSWTEWDFDNFKFIIHELFLYLIAVLMSHERFAVGAHLLRTEYYIGDSRAAYGEPLTGFPTFSQHLRCLGSPQGASET